jgi:hypothetical protein
MSLPLYPTFKKLELSDKEIFEEYTKKFPPYSDYNFVSLWSYNTEDDVTFSFLNDNLVIKLRDYITNEPFYTFLGTNKAEETINNLLTLSATKSVMKKLKLIPEANILTNKEIFDTFLINEDRDNFDHIFSLEKISTLEGAAYSKQRGWINNLLKNYPEIQITQLNSNEATVQHRLVELFQTWEKNKNTETDDAVHELIAIKRLLKNSSHFNLTTVGIFYKNTLIGFSISEYLQNDYSIMHFVKADTNYKGIYQLLYKETARAHFEKGAKYLNREQDLGIEGLRKAKESWSPITFLKKYTISCRQLHKE